MEKTMKERIMHRITGALTVALAVFVLLACWVVCTRQQAGAVTSGTYYVSVDTWAKSTESCWATLYYTRQDGSTGSQSLYVTNDKTWRRDQHYALNGYPTSVRMFTHGNPTSYGEVNVAVYVSPNSDYTTDRICLMNYAKIDVGYIGGADGDYTYHIDTNTYEHHSSHGSDYDAGNHYWPGVGIKDIVFSSQQKRTYTLNSSGNPVYTSWTSSGVTNEVYLDGRTYHEYRVKAYARDKFGVRIGTDPADMMMKGTATYDSTDNYSGVAPTDLVSESDGAWVYGIVEPDAHMQGQNRNRQSVEFRTTFSYNNESKNKSFSFYVTDESYTTSFYDRTGTLRKGTANWNGPDLVDTNRKTFNTATNTSGVQYTYYGDRVIPPFDYTGNDNATTRFNPMAYGASNATARDAATSSNENFHYPWKGWAVAKDEGGTMTTSAVPINNANRFDDAYTGSAARYQTATESLILVESFNKQRHDPTQLAEATYEFSPADCVNDAKYYKVCSDPACRYKFTRRGEGALGRDGDPLWIDIGSQLRHTWTYTPDGTESKGNSTIATAYSETCADAGSNGYFYCRDCGKYFSHLKMDDTSNEYQMMVKDQYGYDTDTPMSRTQVIAAQAIPARGHNYVFKGWTWGTDGQGNPDYTWASGSFECSNTDVCTETSNRVHGFTISTEEPATTTNNMTAVKGSNVHIEKVVKPATCTAPGSITYQALVGSVVVTVITPEGDVLDPDFIDPEAPEGTNMIDYPSVLKTTVALPKLGHDFRGECIGDSRTYDRRTGTYGAHTFRCVRCAMTGINSEYDANNNVTQTIPGGSVAHTIDTVTSSSATCMAYAVCAECSETFGSFAPHDFSDTTLIKSADPASTADDPMGIDEYQGHYYACTYGCGNYGVMVQPEGGSDPASPSVNGTIRHTFNSGELLRPASCEVNGRRVYTCTAPGCNFKHYTTLDPDLLATGHSFSGQPVTLTPFKSGDNYNTTMTASITCQNENCGKFAPSGVQNPVQVKNTVTETVDVIATRLDPTCETDGSVTRTATFTESAFTEGLLNGEPFAATQVDTSEILPATGHNWVNVTVSWSADYSTCTGSAECANDPSHNVTQSAVVTSRTIDNPTCTEPGTAKFTASFEDEFGDTMYYDNFSMPKRSFQDIYNQNQMDANGEIPATGHSWADYVYGWIGDDENGYSAVTARCRCSVCRTPVNETGTVEEVETIATCEEDGSIVWTASFNNSFFNENLADNPRTKILPALGHAYDYDSVKYSSSHSTGGWRFTARATCLNDSSHVESETVVGEVSTIAPTCTTKGKTIYTGTFTNPNFVTQTKTEEIPMLGHKWSEPEITWTQDPDTQHYTAAHAIIVCGNDAEHTIEEDCTDVEQNMRKAPTCSATGLIVYTARFSRDIGTSNKSRVLDKLEHELGEVHHGTPNTCATNGFRDYRICNNCQNFFIEDPVGSGNWVETTNAGTVLPASSEHKDENGNPYTPVDLPAQAPTCVSSGNKAVSYCPACKLIFSIDGVSTYTATVDGEEVQKPLSEKNYRFGKNKSQYELDPDPTAHPSLEKTEGVPATCESVGTLENWYCADCGKYFSDAAGTVVIPKSSITLPLSGHDYDFENAEFTWSDDYSTCTAVAVCRNNAEHILTEEVQSDKNVIEPTTCEEDGRCSFTATFSDPGFGTKTTGEMDDPAPGHAWDKTGEKYKPTFAWTPDFSSCTATVYCKNDKSHSRAYVGTVTRSIETVQDCDVDGKESYTATFEDGVKSDTKTITLPMTGHEWDYTGDTHTVTYEWSPDRSRCTAIVRCLNNPDHKREITVVAELIIIRPSTCTEDGKGVYEATFSYGIPKDDSEEVTLSRSGHNAQRVSATPATCLEKGIYAHYHCKQCGRYFSDIECQHEIEAASVIQDMIPHDLTRHPAITPNCTTGGCPEYWTCGYCGKYFLSAAGNPESETTREAVTLAANGHKWVERPGQQPTCTEAGWKPYNYCLRCKETENYTSIPALGHGDYVYDYANSSVSADGSVRWDIYTCGRGCGAFYANLAVTLRDKNGKGVPGAIVTITNNKTGKAYASGTTDNYGEFVSNAKFTEGAYKITVSYEDANNTHYATSIITFYTNDNHEVGVIPAKLGKTDFVPSTGSNSNSGSGNTQPITPSNVCRWCGQVHTGFFGKIVQFFHNILILFGGR